MTVKLCIPPLHTIFHRETGKDDRPSSINAFCISNESNFPEINEFVDQSTLW